VRLVKLDFVPLYRIAVSLTCLKRVIFLKMNSILTARFRYVFLNLLSEVILKDQQILTRVIYAYIVQIILVVVMLGTFIFELHFRFKQTTSVFL